MFGIGHTELIIIGIIGVLLFGSRLPTVARSFGQSIWSFKKGLVEGELAVAEVENQVEEIKKA